MVIHFFVPKTKESGYKVSGTKCPYSSKVAISFMIKHIQMLGRTYEAFYNGTFIIYAPEY